MQMSVMFGGAATVPYSSLCSSPQSRSAAARLAGRLAMPRPEVQLGCFTFLFFTFILYTRMHTRFKKKLINYIRHFLLTA